MEQERGSLNTWSKREVHCAHGARERFTEHMEQERGSLSTWSKREVHCAHGARERFTEAHGTRERFTEHMEQERGSLGTWSIERGSLGYIQFNFCGVKLMDFCF
jgi:hypothetical protein